MLRPHDLQMLESDPNVDLTAYATPENHVVAYQDDPSEYVVFFAYDATDTTDVIDKRFNKAINDIRGYVKHLRYVSGTDAELGTFNQHEEHFPARPQGEQGARE